MSTELENYRTYPKFEYSRGIKIQMLKDKKDIYENPQKFIIILVVMAVILQLYIH